MSLYDPNDFDNNFKASVIGCIVILVVFFTMALPGCGGEIENAYREIVEEVQITEEERLDKCFKSFADFDHPEKVEKRLLNIVCDMLEDTGLEYFHHSDFRISQHELGRALDFHTTDYSGMGYCERLLRFNADRELILEWLEENSYLNMGFGFYPQWKNPGIHLDTLGLGPAERKRRRWSQINGKYVSRELGMDWLTSELEGCGYRLIPRQRDAGEDSL